MAGSRAVDKASGNVDASVGISERNKTIDKIANNVDVKQKTAGNRAVDRAAENIGGISKANSTERNYDIVSQDNCLSVRIIGTGKNCRVALQDADVDWTKESL